jgi:hypothetical protein
LDTHRRGLLAGLGLTALAAGAAPAAAQTPPAAPRPPLADRLATEAAKHRLAVSFEGQRASGPGVDWLIDQARAARFFLLGEEHGLAQVPALVSTLLPALKPAGYSRLGLEISPPAAPVLDAAAAGGMDALRAFVGPGRGVAFYGMAEEARMLADVRAAFPGKGPLLFGLDYEVLADRLLIETLRTRAPAAARPALDTLDAASKAGWAKYDTTKNLTDILTFSGDPAMVRAVRDAWPRPDPFSAQILDTLEQTLVINQHQTEKRYFLSNDSRAQFNRANWVRFWAAESARKTPPRCFLKFGAGHMVRGRSMTEVYDIGSLVSETAALRGETSFHLLVVPLNGKQAYLNPETLTYASTDVSTIEEMALEPLTKAALPGSSTLIDLRPLRPLMSASVTQTADPRLSRVVHGYDAVLLVAGSTASGNL